MILRLQIFMIISSLLFFLGLIIMISREKLELKYSLVWISAGVLMLSVAVRPQIAVYFSSLAGIVEPVNAVFFTGIIYSLIIIFGLTVCVSRQSVQIQTIARSVALLQKRVEELEKQRDAV